MADFGASIQKLVKGAYPTFDAERQARLTLEFFLAGFLAHCGRAVIGKEPRTFTDALKQAKLVEAGECLTAGLGPAGTALTIAANVVSVQDSKNKDNEELRATAKNLEEQFQKLALEQQKQSGCVQGVIKKPASSL